MIIKNLNDFSGKPEFFDYLQENKKSIIDFKMSKPRYDAKDSLNVSPMSKSFKPISTPIISLTDDVDRLQIKVVANTSMFIDNHLDMLAKNGAKDSILSRMGIIPQLHDHIHQLGAQIGQVTKIAYEYISLRDLGWNADGKANCLVFYFDAVRSLNESVFKQYANGQIKQHSIGLMYEKLVMCVNSDKEWWKEEKSNFDHYYKLAINTERADKNGVFWYVEKWGLLENSAVLFGSNELTPTLEVKMSGNSGKNSLKSAKASYLSEMKAFNKLFNN